MSHNIFKDLFYSFFPKQSKYLTYSKGESNIIISAPHGGDIKPIQVNRRKYGKTLKDTYTRRLVQLVIERLSKKPYYIYSDVHRSIVDLNREFNEATQGEKLAEDIWRSWNSVLPSYLDDVRRKYGRGLYIDIHSHNDNNYFELGYGLKTKDYLDLRSGEEITANSYMSPIPVPQYELLFGDHSLEYGLVFHGYSVLVPMDDKDYFNGGWNVQTYHGNGIGAVQIECPVSILKKDLYGVAIAITNSIEIFKERFLDD